MGESLVTPQTSAVFTKEQCGSDDWQKVLEVKELSSIVAASWTKGGILDAEVKANNIDFHQEKKILICYKKGKKKTSLATSEKWWPSVLFNRL